MLCIKCGLDVERDEQGGWKNGEKNVAYFAHHLCPRENAYIWKRWGELREAGSRSARARMRGRNEGYTLRASLVDFEVPAELVPESFE